MMKAVVVAAACSLGSIAVQAADGVLIVEQSTTGTKTQTHQIQIAKDRIRAETTGAAGEKQAMVFDGAKQVMWMINYDKKTYSEMTKADVDRLGGQMSDAMTKMQQQMANLPPEQRARIEAMMAGRGMAPGAAPKTEYKKVGTDKVGKWTCDKYEGSRNGQKTAELCTVDPPALGFTAADLEVAHQLQAFFEKVMPPGADNMFRIGTGQGQEFSGVPVRRVSFGATPTTSEVTAVSRQSFPDATFAVPDGFQKEASPFAGRGRGRGGL